MDASDETINPVAHKRMLKAIGNLSTNQHITKHVRDEKKLEQGEFNLYKGVEIHVSNDNDILQRAESKKRQQPVAIKDIIQVLNRNDKHLKTGKRLKNINTTKKVLPKPLEKPVADRIKRGIGYEKLQDKLTRWDAIVAKNRSTDQQVFPLTSETIYVNTNAANGKREFAVKSDLMRQMEEADNKLEALKRQKIGDTDNPKELEEFENKWLQEKITRKELIARSREIRYLKMLESAKSAKARLRNRIKSKKYHKLLKRQKLKKEIESFELLQKTDPEAALEKLNALEKSRVLERASLRHKNTGLWAKNLQVRAKYNKDVRKDLAEQLKTSRQLTQKLEDNESDESDNNNDDNYNIDEIDELIQKDVGENKDEFNPWIQITKKETKSEHKELGEESWRKYWLEHNRKMALKTLNDKINEEDMNDTTNEELLKQNEISNKGAIKTKKSTNVEKKKKNISSLEDRIDNEMITNSLKKERNVKKQEEVDETCSFDADNLDDIFEDKQRHIEATLSKKIEALKKYNDTLNIGEKKKRTKQKKEKDNLKNLKDLSFKVQPNVPDIDEELIDNDKLDANELEAPNKITDSLKIIPIDEDLGSNKNKLLPPIPERNKISKEKTIDPNISIVTLDDDLKTMKDCESTLHCINDAMAEIDTSDDEEKSVGGVEYDKMTIAEAFADDDIVSDFQREKEEESTLKNTEIDLGMPGWGSWAGAGISEEKMARQNKRRIFKIIPQEKRRDENKDGVYINEDISKHLRSHLVSDVPYPFTSVKDYEASIRAPLGRHFVSETSFRLLTKPSVITKKGQIITPMDESELIKPSPKPRNSVDVRIAQMKKVNKRKAY